MLVHCRVTLSNKFTGIHLYTWLERGTVRVKCLPQTHNTMSPARARTWTARSGVEHSNHEATAPLLFISIQFRYSSTVIIYLPVQDGDFSFVSFARQAALFNHHQATPPFLFPLSGHIDRVVILELFQL